jgi:phosphatidylglycerophosphate synthase
MSSPPPVQRIQRNLLAIGERRLLTWLSGHMPASVTPDRLTTVGFLGAVGVGAGFALSSYDAQWLWLAIASFFVNWFGDSLDGSLARYRKIERPEFGYFIDHSMDALGNMIIMLGIGLSPFVRLDIALFGLATYLLLSIHTFLSARVTGEFNLTYLAGGPTEMRIILIIMALCMMKFGVDMIGRTQFTGFDAFVGGLAIILLILFAIQTIATGSKLRARGR